MSTTSAPFGLKPVYHPSGTVIPVSGTITSGYASTIFQYSPVAYVADGSIELAAAGSPAIGSFSGVRYVDANGRPQFSNKWTAATVGTQIVAWFTSDPDTIYEIQGAGSIAQLDIGEQADWSANTTSSGNTTTGISNVTIGTPAVTTAGLQVIGISVGPDNDWGDAFTVVRVRINEHQNSTATAGY
jgi:hypothetical protein